MTTLNIKVLQDDQPSPWDGPPHPTHHATTNHGGIEALIIPRAMASGDPGVALRTIFENNDDGTPGPYVVLELSLNNIDALLGALRGVKVRTNPDTNG